MTRFVLTLQAAQDLSDIWAYIAADSVNAADRVLAALERAMQKLARSPRIGHMREELADKHHRFFLVFSYLIVPTLAANLLGGSVARRLAMAWGFGTLVSVIAMVASAMLDLPTGATVVCAFGLILLLLAVITRARGGMAPA